MSRVSGRNMSNIEQETAEVKRSDLDIRYSLFDILRFN